MLLNEASIDGAGADHHVGAFAHCDVEEFFKFFNWRRQIGIGEKNIITPGSNYTLTHSMALAVVFGVTENSQARQLNLLNHLLSVVRGSVVDNDDLRPNMGLLRKFLDFLDGNTDSGGLIKGRNNDRDRGMFVYHTLLGLS